MQLGVGQTNCLILMNTYKTLKEATHKRIGCAQHVNYTNYV